MADQNFRVKRGLEVGIGATVLTATQYGFVGIGSTNPTSKLDVVGDTRISGVVTATTFNGQINSGVGTISTLESTNSAITTLNGTNLTYTNADIDNAYITAGIITTVAGTNLTYTNADIDNLYATVGVVTTLQGTDVSYVNAYVITGIVTTIQGTDVSYTNAYANIGVVTTIAGTNLTYTNADIDNAYVTTGIVTTLQGTDVSYTNAYANVGVVTTIAGTNLTYTNADIDNAYVTTGIVTTLQGTDVSYTNAYITAGILTTIAGTNLTYTNADIDNAYVNVGVVTTIAGTNLTYTNADIDNAYITAGILTTIAGTNLTYTNADIDNAYVNVGVVTTIAGTNLTYTNISNIGGISTLGQTSATNLTTDQLSVSGVATFQSNVNLGDNDRLRFGDGNDLQIYHDSFGSFINESGTGRLRIGGGSEITIENAAFNEYKARFVTDGPVELYYDNSKKFETTGYGVQITGSTNVSGVVTATEFHTGVEGSSIRVLSDRITGPSSIVIDPAAIGDDTGVVRIKGDLYVDGTQFIVNSGTIDLADLRVGIATTVSSNLLLDGGGIGIGSANVLKTFTYNNASDSLKSSENLDVASGKEYKINGNSVLNATTLGTGVTASSLTQVGTLDNLSVSGNLNVTTNTSLSGSLTVTNQATFNHNVTINAANRLFSIQNGSAVPKFEVDTDNGNTTIYGTLNAQGAVDLDSTLNVQGAVDLDSTLNVDGSTTLVGSVSMGSTMGVVGNTNLYADLIVDFGTLKVESSTNRVGVNKLSPEYPLDVTGDINTSTAIKVNGVSVIQSAVDEALALAIALG